jgi:hypothetical protein
MEAMFKQSGIRKTWYKAQKDMRKVFPNEVKLATERLSREGLSECSTEIWLIEIWHGLSADERKTFPDRILNPDETFIRCYHASGHCAYNRAELMASDLVGCYYCLQVYLPTEIKKWEPDQTAICPHCGVDSVIGSASGFPINEQFLREMHNQYVGIPDSISRQLDAGKPD